MAYVYNLQVCTMKTWWFYLYFYNDFGKCGRILVFLPSHSEMNCWRGCNKFCHVCFTLPCNILVFSWNNFRAMQCSTSPHLVMAQVSNDTPRLPIWCSLRRTRLIWIANTLQNSLTAEQFSFVSSSRRLNLHESWNSNTHLYCTDLNGILS